MYICQGPLTSFQYIFKVIYGRYAEQIFSQLLMGCDAQSDSNILFQI